MANICSCVRANFISNDSNQTWDHQIDLRVPSRWANNVGWPIKTLQNHLYIDDSLILKGDNL